MTQANKYNAFSSYFKGKNCVLAWMCTLQPHRSLVQSCQVLSIPEAVAFKATAIKINKAFNNSTCTDLFFSSSSFCVSCVCGGGGGGALLNHLSFNTNLFTLKFCLAAPPTSLSCTSTKTQIHTEKKMKKKKKSTPANSLYKYYIRTSRN